jgi:N-acetylmuramoyl-L-alanine amidase
VPRTTLYRAACFCWCLGVVSLTLACRLNREPAPAGFPADPRSPASWATLPALPSELPPQAVLLKGLRVALDPGHGGDTTPEHERSGYKRGPTGLREAVINQRVADKLRELLEASGAVVVMTRTDDVEVPLAERVRIANDTRADVFLSIHHNAGNETANYASVWYHRDGEAAPASLDISRELADALVWWMRHPQPISSGSYSDLLMYREGFSVLRDLRMPGVLAECSFFSNRIEEQRLRDPGYNDRTAWALYLGLANWASAGIPRWRVREVERGPGNRQVMLVELLDGMKEGWGGGTPRVRAHTIRVTVDGEAARGVEWDGALLRIDDPGLFESGRERVLDVRFENRAKNASITPPLLLPAASAGDAG